MDEPTRREEPSDEGLGLDERLSLARIESMMFGVPPVAVRVDRYELQEVIGTGGMGVVRAAWDPELRRRVAIKLVQVGEVGTNGASRLLREAQAIARISHPNVIPVHDVGTYAANSDEREATGRSVFVVMELVEGVDLDRWLERRGEAGMNEPRPWTEVLEVFVAAGRGLAAAHAAGILHRDFKPSNVLVGRDGRVRVVDFGLARPTAGSAAAEPSVDESEGLAAIDPLHTRTGTVLGTPYYMAPEQLEGEDASERSDQYAFAVALYLGVFGRGPFARHEVRRLAKAKRHGDILPPPTATSVPQWLTTIIRRALSPRAEDRFASMQALLDAIDHDRRRRTTITRALLGGVVIVGATAIGLGLGRLDKPDTAPSRAAAPALAAPAQAVAEDLVASSVLAFTELDSELGGDIGDELAWAVDGLPNLMVEELRDRDGLRVLAYHPLKHATAGLSPDERMQRLAARGATAIVASELRREGESVVLAIVVRDVAGAVLHQHSIATDPTALADDGRALARWLGERITGHPVEIAKSSAGLPITYERALQLGITALHRFELDAAERYFEEAHQLAPEGPAARFYAAIVAEWKGGGPDAAERYAEAAASTLTSAQRRYVEASQLRLASGHAGAVEAFRAAAAVYPDDTYLAYGLFEALYHSGDGDGALVQMSRLAELAPRFVIPWMHVMDRAIAIGDAATLERALESAQHGGANERFLAIWGVRARVLVADTEGARAQLQAMPDDDDGDAQLLDIALHAVRGDLALALARASQRVDRGDVSWLRPQLALCTAMGDAACRNNVLTRERRRLGRAARSDLATIEWLALVVHEAIVGDEAQLEAVMRTLSLLAEPHMIHDLRYALTTTLVAAAVDDNAVVDAATRSPFAEVRAVAQAVVAARTGDHGAAIEHWKHALGLALDSRFVAAERLGLARSQHAAGAMADARATCDAVITPGAFDWSWGAAVGPCLSISAQAAAALGDTADARARYERLIAQRSAADPDDALVAAARSGLAKL